MRKKSTKPSSNSGSAKAKSEGLDRPFDPAILADAKAIAASYRITIEPEPDVGYLGSSLEMPYVMADGATVASCFKATLEALTGAVATMLEQGKRPPVPASEALRNQQVNIRLTAEEKYRLESAARSMGYRSISDFVRATALGRAG